MHRLFFLLLPVLAKAAEEAAEVPENLTYKWINFGILVAAIVYLIAKYLIPVLKARASSIGQDLADSKATVVAAEAKVRELTSKLSNFETEIKEIRDRAMAERENEAKRIAEQTHSLMAKLSTQRETEITNATQVAQSQLRSFTALKAIEIAQARFALDSNEQTQGALVQAFVSDLHDRQELR